MYENEIKININHEFTRSKQPVKNLVKFHEINEILSKIYSLDRHSQKSLQKSKKNHTFSIRSEVQKNEI